MCCRIVPDNRGVVCVPGCIPLLQCKGCVINRVNFYFSENLFNYIYLFSGYGERLIDGLVGKFSDGDILNYLSFSSKYSNLDGSYGLFDLVIL